jgi:hypothetical protein
MSAKRDESTSARHPAGLSRFVQEVPTVTIEEALLALSALATLGRLEKDGKNAGRR